MAFVDVPKTQSDLDVIQWWNEHLQLQSSQYNHALVFEVVTEDEFSPTGNFVDKFMIISNPFNGLTQKFGYDLATEHPDEALLEISKWLQVGIKQWEYYRPPSHAAPPTIIDGHDTSLKPFHPEVGKDGMYLANENDKYPVNYVWRDENGSYQKIETQGWAFVPYYRWVKINTTQPIQTQIVQNREFNPSSPSNEELETKLRHLNELTLDKPSVNVNVNEVVEEKKT